MPQATTTPSENRRHERVGTTLRCWCEGENVTVYARIGNLSEGGLFLRTSTPMPEGARTLVRFRDGDSREVSAEATVVWARSAAGELPAGMGLRFGPMPQEDLESLRRLLEQQKGPG